MNFWQKLPRPFTALAPMEGISDCVYRQIVALCGKPDVMFTEFISARGLLSDGADKVSLHLTHTQSESPLVVQLFGDVPEEFFRAAQIVRSLGFAGIDINMGCPARDVVKKGGGAALINDPKLAAEVVSAVRDGAGNLPVSVKTRLGYHQISLDSWIPFILSQKPDALTIHLRTFKQKYSGPARWDLVTDIIRLRNDLSAQTVIVGNGDMKNIDAVTKNYKKYGVEGYMIGRAVLFNPWAFSPNRLKSEITNKERLTTYLKHVELFESTWEGQRNPADLKKYCHAYVNTLYDASTFRNTMMQLKTTAEFKTAIRDKIKSLR